jgi:outer membrane lipopolysaccharide assembly protein LptE/RlpB
MIGRRRLLAVLSAAALLPLSGCGYSLAGRGAFLPAYIKTIGVPLFTNNTAVFDVERQLTDAVRTELIGRGRYTVVPETTGADAVLSGEIVSITLTVAGFTGQQQAARQVLTLIARVELRDLKTNKIVWSNPGLQFSEQYDLTNTTTADDPNAFLRQDANAMQRLSSEFARAVVSAMLEAF